MPFEVKLAWKYFRARRKSLARFTAVAAVAGIAAGVASLIVAQSLARGFAEEMQDKILANTAHVAVFSAGGAPIENWREIKENLEKIENVKEVSAASFESAMVLSDDASSYAILRTETVAASQVSNSAARNEEKTGDARSDEQIFKIAVGDRLAEKTNLKIGDAAEIVVLENQTQPKRVKVTVGEIFRTGLYEYDATWIRLTPADFAGIHGRKIFTPVNLNVSVGDIFRAGETAREIKQSLGENFRTLDWQEANEPLFAALSLERKVSLAIISLIIFIAVLNITTTLALLVNERRLDIAVLRTCGAKTKNLIGIFLLEGFFLGFFGIALGVALGLLGCFLGNYFRVINLSAEVYSLNSIPFRPTSASVALIVAVALFLSVAASVFPAFRASRIKPLENLRAQ